jgi:predicted DNA-binding protein (MmcQ/YjbR family)
LRRTHRGVRTFALGLPGAYEDHPWGESVAKVNKKVFASLGAGDDPVHLGFTVKLTDSHEQALSVPGATPTGYGLGKAGWVSIPIRDTTPPLAVLNDWIEESYRLIAPKKLVAELDPTP